MDRLIFGLSVVLKNKLAYFHFQQLSNIPQYYMHVNVKILQLSFFFQPKPQVQSFHFGKLAITQAVLCQAAWRHTQQKSQTKLVCDRIQSNFWTKNQILIKFCLLRKLFACRQNLPSYGRPCHLPRQILRKVHRFVNIEYWNDEIFLFIFQLERSGGCLFLSRHRSHTKGKFTWIY